MKISSVSSVKNHQNNNVNNKTNNNSKNVNFNGGMDALVNFWQFIDNSRALQFTVEDMFGTNFPRTYKGAMAGYKYTGKINIPALLQEALREFLTGPTMCVVPIVILSQCLKHTGKTSDTHIENIANLSYLAKNSAKDGLISQEGFYKTVADDMLTSVLGKEKVKKEDIEKLTTGLLKLDTATLEKTSRKALKQNKKEALANLQNTYSEILKNNSDSYKGINFLNAKYSINEAKKGATKFKNYASYTTSYYQDLAKKYLKNGDSLIDASKIKDFKISWLGKRGMIIASMIGITGVLMSVIPKIYTWASGGVNPNASAIYDEAGKTTNKEAK